MTSESEKRGRTLKDPPMEWVRTANHVLHTKRSVTGTRFTKRMIAETTGFSEFQVGRVLNEDPKLNVPNVEVIIATSRVLGIAAPSELSGADRTEMPAAVDTNDPKAATIRKNLRRLRVGAGYDRAGAEDATGISFETIAKYEDGELKVTLTDLEIFARTYGHDVGHFYLDDPPPTTLGPYDDIWRRRGRLEALDPEIRSKLRERHQRATQQLLEEIDNLRPAKKKQAEAMNKARHRKKL